MPSAGFSWTCRVTSEKAVFNDIRMKSEAEKTHRQRKMKHI
jgi:hypothetical protein